VVTYEGVYYAVPPNKRLLTPHGTSYYFYETYSDVHSDTIASEL